MRRLAQSTSRVITFRVFLSTDHVTPATGKTIAITIAKNGGAFANPNAGATNATEMSSGFYKVTLDTTDTNTLGDLDILGTSSGMDDFAITVDVVSATTGGASNLDVASSTLATAANLATVAGYLDTEVAAILAAVDTEVGTIVTQTSAASIRTALGLASANLDTQLDALPTNAELATAIAGGDDAVLAAIAGLNNLSAAQVNAEVDTALADYDAPTKAELDAAVSPLATSAALAVVDGIVDDILLDTAEIGTAGAGLTNINLPNQTMDIVGNITGNLSGSVGSVTGLTASNLDATISSRLAASSYTAPPSAATVAGAVRTELTTELARIDAAVSSRLAAGSYTAPDNVSIAAILLDTAEIGVAGAGLTALPWNAAWDAEVQSEAADALAAYDPPTHAELTAGLAGADDTVLAAIAALTIPSASANAAAVLAAAFEGAETVQDFLRLSRAVLYGESNGLGGSTVHHRDKADTKNRLTTTIDDDGNRSALTLDAT